jgi:hypothetical protein
MLDAQVGRSPANMCVSLAGHSGYEPRRQEPAREDTTPGTPETERDMTWPAHVKVDMRRGSRVD